jgi:hypothetical protein
MSISKLTIVVLFGLIGALAGANPRPQDAASKVEMLGKLEQKFADLTRLASECGRGLCESKGDVDQRLVDERVRTILVDVKDGDLLFRIAAFSYLSAYPQTAGLQKVDSVFDSSWNQALRQLGALQTPESLAALRALDHSLHTQGGERLALQSLIEQTEHALEKKKK